MPTSSTPTGCPDVASWQRLVDDTRRLIGEGQHPDDATWQAVMAATATDDQLLAELADTAPDPDAYDHYDVESAGAEKQSLVLGNLRVIVGASSASC